jgi:hypothetical protein
MSALDEVIRQIVRDELRRHVRPEALASDSIVGDDDDNLIERARESASRIRRARRGGGR